ncbi:uncharacterized protein BDZ99DRAFT_277744 [Mytilinidion resinicola]|uniref:Uncharacterized protein n=1 Tax=Mytilinidion resinicola TaxID=574789 RepID=A0A6A6YU97_9PEZI|nr:uncharacterized protein BDZ99DRAFT_277744 [Mytilinidion resinicola]KAF2811604.1 hypothetical protein BDZ99DRAFT_277744 [Mytilinidion resinicola]
MEVAKADELANRKVHWYGRTSRLRSGVISSRMHQVWFYGRETFAALWSVSGGAKGGDTGAWVIDDRSRVCSYLIATNMAKRIAYICPMEGIMEDIKQTLGAESVCLPGSSEAKEYHDLIDSELDNDDSLSLEEMTAKDLIQPTSSSKSQRNSQRALALSKRVSARMRVVKRTVSLIPKFTLGDEVRLRLINGPTMKVVITNRRLSPKPSWQYTVKESSTGDDSNQDNLGEYGEWIDEARLSSR